MTQTKQTRRLPTQEGLDDYDNHSAFDAVDEILVSLFFEQPDVEDAVRKAFGPDDEGMPNPNGLQSLRQCLAGTTIRTIKAARREEQAARREEQKRLDHIVQRKEQMNQDLEAVMSLIEARTEIDLRHKSISDLTLSAMEELGEFSREIKIEEGIFGNTHKEPDTDGSQGEAIDIAIMGICLYFARGGNSADIARRMQIKVDKWALHQEAELPLGGEKPNDEGI